MAVARGSASCKSTALCTETAYSDEPGHLSELSCTNGRLGLSTGYSGGNDRDKHESAVIAATQT